MLLDRNTFSYAYIPPAPSPPRIPIRKSSLPQTLSGKNSLPQIPPSKTPALIPSPNIFSAKKPYKTQNQTRIAFISQSPAVLAALAKLAPPPAVQPKSAMRLLEMPKKAPLPPKKEEESKVSNKRQFEIIIQVIDMWLQEIEKWDKKIGKRPRGTVSAKAITQEIKGWFDEEIKKSPSPREVDASKLKIKRCSSPTEPITNRLQGKFD